MKHWIIEEAHNQNWLFDCEYNTYEEAVYNLNCIEETDKRNNEYAPERYRIVEIETYISVPDDWNCGMTKEEVIHCKDCKHFNDGDCEELPKIVSETDFCSFAERK